jgi:nitrogen fixation/metabolism regulation signal transduction histidine kinase
MALVAGLVLFVVPASPVVFTHKIAGPIFKMKRLFRQVGEGKLVLREKLRKGDELVHFFEAFEKMVDQLRDKQKREIEEVDIILKQLEDERGDGVGVKQLRTLRAEMVDHLEP